MVVKNYSMYKSFFHLQLSSPLMFTETNDVFDKSCLEEVGAVEEVKSSKS